MNTASIGSMAALLGFDRSDLEAAMAQTDGVVLANDNNDGQVVISGTPDAVEALMNQVKSKRAVKLNVSGAFHSPLMADAADAFTQVLNNTPFNSAQIPVLSNTDPTPSIDAEVLKARLIRQMTGTVRWRKTSRWSRPVWSASRTNGAEGATQPLFPFWKTVKNLEAPLPLRTVLSRAGLVCLPVLAFVLAWVGNRKILPIQKGEMRN